MMQRSRRTLIAVSVLTGILTTAASAQVMLQFKPGEGERTVISTIKSVQTLTIGGMEVPTESDVEARTVLKYGKTGADGTQRMEEKTERFALKLSVPGGGLDFDSDKPEAAKIEQAAFQPLADGLKALNGTSYTLVFRGGKVVGIEGLDAVLQKLTPESAAMFKEDLNPKRITRDWQQQLDSLPDKAVQKGDTWRRKEVMSLGGGQTFTLDTSYEYQGIVEKNGRTLDKVNIFYTGVRYETSPETLGGLKVVESNLKVEHSFGHYLFDRERGDVVERTTNTRVAGPLTFEINGMQLGGKVDLTLDVGTTVK